MVKNIKKVKKGTIPALPTVNYAETISPQVLRRLREATAPPGQRGLWLRHLSDNQLVEVYYMAVEAHHSAYQVAKYAQEAWGMHPTSSPQSLARSVTSFAQRVASAPQQAALGGADEEEVGRIDAQIDAAKSKADGLDVMAWTVLTLQNRIKDVLIKEKKAMPFKMTTQMLKTLSEVTDRYLHWQKELGVLDAPPPELNINLSSKFGGLLANTIGKDKDLIVHATERFMEEIDKRSLVLKQGADGKYGYVAKDKK